MWLTAIGSPVSGSGIRQVSACLCCRSKTSASACAAPRSLGWSTTSLTRSPSTQTSRGLRRPFRNCSPVRAGIPCPFLAADGLSAHRPGLGKRRQLRYLGVPGLQFGMAGPPRLVGIAEVEVAQCAADGDLTDGLELAQAARVLLEDVEGTLHLALLQLDIGLAAVVLRQRDLAAARLGGVQDAVAQRLLADRLPARRTGGGKEFWCGTDAVEVLADHRAVEELHAVVSDQGRHLGQRIEVEQCGIGRADLPALDLVADAAGDGAGGDLADIGAGGRISELHGDLPLKSQRMAAHVIPGAPAPSIDFLDQRGRLEEVCLAIATAIAGPRFPHFSHLRGKRLMQILSGLFRVFPISRGCVAWGIHYRKPWPSRASAG